MNRGKALSFFSVLLLAIFSSSACSGPKGGVICPGGNCGGNGTVAVTMVADTLPAHPSLLTFQVTITSLKFTSSGGTSTTVNLTPALTVDLMRLQSDTVFLGTFANIPAVQYNSVTLVLTGNANITFLNDTGATLSACPANTICPLSVAASSNPVANLSFAVSQNGVIGIGIDLNFANAISISGSSLALNFSNNSVLSALILPRANSNLASGQLDLIEDFTGVVSLSNSVATITSAAVTGRGLLSASANSNTILNSDPSQKLCLTPTPGQVSSCVANNQFASMDAVLKSDGTLSIQEIEPLLGTLQDTVEGTVVVINTGNTTQFTLIVTDLIPAATNSLIGTLHVGEGLVVNLVASPTFLVDTKGLSVLAGNLSNFVGQTNTAALHLGQTVAVHVIAPFTAAVGTTLASATSDTVTLRWSRITATPVAPFSPNIFNLTSFPSYFAATGTAEVQDFAGTPGTPGITNFDGIADGSGLNASKPVALRTLFIENPTNSAVPAFFAAKVRQH
jgi:uncharacterized repeat protein (TIGR01451 family)